MSVKVTLKIHGDQACKKQTAIIRKHAPNAFDFTNRRYRGLHKNANRLFLICALAGNAQTDDYMINNSIK